MYKYFLALVILISVNIYSENLNNKIITTKEILTLDPAKNANFTILSANPLTIDSLDIKIMGAIVEGRFFQPHKYYLL
jgi:hypothetical protein